MSVKAWSDDQENELISLYTKDSIKDVHELAKHFGKGYRSVISKLVQLKIYEKPEANEVEKGQTVKIMLRDLENLLEIPINIFKSGNHLTNNSYFNDLFNTGFAILFRRIKFILLSLFFLSCFI